MSRDGYERWEDRPDGQVPDAYEDPRGTRRSRRAARPDEKWPADSGPQETHNRQGSHRRSDPDGGADGGAGYGGNAYGGGAYGDSAYGGGAYEDGAYGGGAHSGGAHSGGAHGDSRYGDSGYGDGGGYAGNGYGGGYAGNGYGDAGYRDKGYAGYTSPGQAGYDHPDDDQSAGFGRTAGYPDARYPSRTPGLAPRRPVSGRRGRRHLWRPSGARLSRQRPRVRPVTTADTRASGGTPGPTPTPAIRRTATARRLRDRRRPWPAGVPGSLRSDGSVHRARSLRCCR